MFLLRVKLQDRPGALGVVATAIGTVGGDIEAIEIVERGAGYAINHFMVELPNGAATDSLVSACVELPDVEVLWISRYPSSWGIESDIRTLEGMAKDPIRAREILVTEAPAMFYAQWALLITEDGTTITRSELAPELTPSAAAVLVVRQAARSEYPADWASGWGAVTTAAAPLQDGSVIILGRSGGPWFLDSELNRLKHLATLAG